MYPVTGLETIELLTDVPPIDVGAPMPIVMSNDSDLVLCYHVSNGPFNLNNGKTILVRGTSPNKDNIAVIRFWRYLSLLFGMPNDEAFRGHPLQKQGLHPYAAFRVNNSEWIRQLEKMNSVHPNHNSEEYAQQNHFVFAFHDLTFECVARNYEVTLYRADNEAEMKKAMAKIIWDNNYD